MLLVAAAFASSGVCPVRAVYYRDEDGDGYGDPDTSRVRCFKPWGHPGWSTLAGDCDDTDATHATHCADYAVYWGDPHVHTSLSNDGCEDPDNWCLPEGDAPAEYVADNVIAAGLSWAAVTDHAEWDTYNRVDLGTSLDIWQTAQDRIADASGVILILGFEFTASYGHRTVILDTDAACDAYRPYGDATKDYKLTAGYESYTEGTDDGLTSAADFEAWMDAAKDVVGCDEVRWASWRHHTAYPIPKVGNWARADQHIASDTVVEVASQHGNSECSDITQDGCDWHVDESRFNAAGATQTALALGYAFGFVGGSDRHDAHPWSRGESPSYSGHFLDTDGDGVEETPAQQTFTGAITGVLVPDDEPFTRTSIFDALDARHTFAASWNFTGLRVVATSADGQPWWPGDDVPEDVGPLTLTVELDDPDVTAWSYDLVNPADGSFTADSTVTLAPGDVRYVRIRAWVDGEEQRVWASPWFGT